MLKERIFGELLVVSEKIGKIEEAHMYGADFMAIELETPTGEKVRLSATIKEKTKDE